MYNDKSAKDLLAQYPQRLAEGGPVGTSVSDWKAPVVNSGTTGTTVNSGSTSLAVQPRTVNPIANFLHLPLDYLHRSNLHETVLQNRKR